MSYGSWNYCNRGLETNHNDYHRGFMNVTVTNKFEYAPNQGYDTIAHRFPMATFASCKYPIPSKHSFRPPPPLPLPYAKHPAVAAVDSAGAVGATPAAAVPQEQSVIIQGDVHQLDNAARTLALNAYTRGLHATTINPSQHPTQSSVVPVARSLTDAGLLGASSDLKADGRKQYRGPSKFDQSGTGKHMIEHKMLALERSTQLLAQQQEAARQQQQLQAAAATATAAVGSAAQRDDEKVDDGGGQEGAEPQSQLSSSGGASGYDAAVNAQYRAEADAYRAEVEALAAAEQRKEQAVAAALSQQRGSTPKKPASPLLARLAKSPLAQSVRPATPQKQQSVRFAAPLKPLSPPSAGLGTNVTLDQNA